MTLYCWMHWFWITFTLSLRWFLLCGYFSLPLKSTTATHLNTKLNQNYSEQLASVNNLPDVNTNLPSSNFLINQTDKTNKTELLHFGAHKVSAAALPKNETIVIDRSSNSTKENIFGTNTTLVNISCSVCNETKNSSSTIENYNFRQSLVVNSNYSIINKQNETSVSSLSAAGITGISLGCLSFMLIITVIAFVAYRNLGFNRPQVLNDRCSNPDSSGYIDDSTMRENSEEMYSLDNDSFLNSLEAMTIQNLWTDTVKHTKL